MIDPSALTDIPLNAALAVAVVVLWRRQTRMEAWIRAMTEERIADLKGQRDARNPPPAGA